MFYFQPYLNTTYLQDYLTVDYSVNINQPTYYPAFLFPSTFPVTLQYQNQNYTKNQQFLKDSLDQIFINPSKKSQQIDINQKIKVISSNQVDKISENPNNVDQNKKKRHNIRNIIPNLCKKLLRFLSSPENKDLIYKIKPNISHQQLMNYYSYVESLKKENNLYFGNKDLRRMWYKESKSVKKLFYKKVTRILSYYYLQNMCVSSILLSKKMKPELKQIHLKYSRKLIRSIKMGKWKE